MINYLVEVLEAAVCQIEEMMLIVMDIRNLFTFFVSTKSIASYFVDRWAL